MEENYVCGKQGKDAASPKRDKERPGVDAQLGERGWGRSATRMEEGLGDGQLKRKKKNPKF